MTTQFMAPARKGEQLCATARIVGGGKSINFVEGELKSDSGKLIATATGLFKRVPPHRLADGANTTSGD